MEYLRCDKLQILLTNFSEDSDKVFYFIPSACRAENTFVLRRYCEEQSAALYIKLPQEASSKLLMLEMLYSLKAPIITTNLAHMLKVLKLGLLEKRISFIVLDDFRINSNKQQVSEVFDFLKHLSKEAAVKLIISSTEIPEISEQILKSSNSTRAI